jgi:hypothetical protein
MDRIVHQTIIGDSLIRHLTPDKVPFTNRVITIQSELRKKSLIFSQDPTRTILCTYGRKR